MGFGKPLFKAMEKNPKAEAILFMTENPYGASLKAEQERFDYFESRHGSRPTTYRTGRCFQEADEERVGKIITFGDVTKLPTGNVIKRIFPTGLCMKSYTMDIECRDRKHFLCLASDGFILKGYDLLIELFNKHPDWTLHFCGGNLHQNLNTYNMKQTENIVDEGYVYVDSARFKELCDLCGAILLFSCSEGMPTSLLTGMRAGLVPITTTGIGMDDVADYAIIVDDYHLDSLEKALEEYIALPEEKYRDLAEKIYSYANETFSLAHFSEVFRTTIEDLIG